MFAGHVGAALAIGRAERRLNVAVFVTAALLSDLLLWLFVLLGWEAVTVPSDFAVAHQLQFTFPYSHGLLASLFWSLLAAAGAWIYCGHLGPARARAAALMAAAVFSHWLLDALVHRPEMPVGGAASHAVGLGLWDNMPAALSAEGAITALGLAVFLRASGLSRGRSTGIAVLCVVILVFTVAGMTVAPAPPSVLAMAGSSLATLVAVCAPVAWFGRLARQREA